MAQVCQMRDDSGLHGGSELAQGAEHGFRWIIIDGLHGFANALRSYPVQHCQFHQMMTARHYLAGTPDIKVSLEFLSLSCGMAE